MHNLLGKCSIITLECTNSLVPALPALSGEPLVRSRVKTCEIPGEIPRKSEIELDTVT